MAMIDVSAARSPAASWSRPARESAPRTCLHHLVERQAERTPEAPALLFGEETLSYRQLDRRANQLARHLSTLRVGPEVVVGLATDRCL